MASSFGSFPSNALGKTCNWAASPWVLTQWDGLVGLGWKGWKKWGGMSLDDVTFTKWAATDLQL